MAEVNDNADPDLLHCPLCDFSSKDSYSLALHVEESHFAEDSPFVACNDKDHGSNAHQHTGDSDRPHSNHGNDEEYVPCPEVGCAEQVPWMYLQHHLALHVAEQLDVDGEVNSVSSLLSQWGAARYHKGVGTDGNGSDTSNSDTLCLERSAVEDVPRRRLGKKELGPYAFEEHMPAWLYKQLVSGSKTTIMNRIGLDGRLYRETSIENEVSGMVPMLAELLELDSSVDCAYLCHQSVKHIFKAPHEGSFCGYRNIQMLISVLLESQWRVGETLRPLNGGIPSVIDLQDDIERAWDSGFNTHARLETGGIRGTRKYIGSSEVQALLKYWKIPCKTGSFSNSTATSSSARPTPACEHLFNHVQDYFTKLETSGPNLHAYPESRLRTSSSSTNIGTKVYTTALPPIYLQQPGHSLTIVGFETHKKGPRNLLVLDPGFKPSTGISKLLSNRSSAPSTSRKLVPAQSWLSTRRDLKPSQAVKLLGAYRRGKQKLGRYSQFETVQVIGMRNDV